MNLPPFQFPTSASECLPPEYAASLLLDVEDYAKEVALHAVEATIVANYGPAIGPAIFADLSGTASVSNEQLAPGKRASVSKAACKLRRGLGLPIRCAKKARPRSTAPAQNLHSVEPKAAA